VREHIYELTHIYFDFFVEPMKKWFPQQVTFWRPDNQEGLFAERSKPLGYWLGHVAGYAVIVIIGLVIYFSIK
jgi:hypothetical protein